MLGLNLPWWAVHSQYGNHIVLLLTTRICGAHFGTKWLLEFSYFQKSCLVATPLLGLLGMWRIRERVGRFIAAIHKIAVLWFW